MLKLGEGGFESKDSHVDGLSDGSDGILFQHGDCSGSVEKAGGSGNSRLLAELEELGGGPVTETLLRVLRGEMD